MYTVKNNKSAQKSGKNYRLAKYLKISLAVLLAFSMLVTGLPANTTPAKAGNTDLTAVQDSHLAAVHDSNLEAEQGNASAVTVDYDPEASRLVVQTVQGTDLYALAAAAGGELVRTGPLDYCTIQFMTKDYAEDFHANINQDKILAKVLEFPGVLSAEWSKTYRLSETQPSSLTDLSISDKSPASPDLPIAGSTIQKSTGFPGFETAASVQATVTDPEYGLQWAIKKIRADRAWEAGAAGQGVIIAVVDTGVDLDHPDLVDDALSKTNLIQGYNAFTRSALPGADQDDNGHGTSVAGVIAALNNNKGIIGIAHEATIMPIKAMDAAGEGEDSIIADGIIWAVDHGAKIINMSIGSEEQVKILDDALQYAADKGCLLVAASGNIAGYQSIQEITTQANPSFSKDNYSTGSREIQSYEVLNPKIQKAGKVAYPGAHPSVMAVSAVDMADKITDFSLTGPEVMLSAPGQRILTDYWSETETGCAYSTGTSIAAPIVSAAAALIWSKYPNLTAGDIEQALYRSAYDLGIKGRDDQYGFGRLDVYRALKTLEDPKLYYSPAALEWEGGRVYSGGTAENPDAVLTVPADTFPLKVNNNGSSEKITISLGNTSSPADFPEGIQPAGEAILLSPWGEVPAGKALTLKLKLNGQDEAANTVLQAETELSAAGEELPAEEQTFTEENIPAEENLSEEKLPEEELPEATETQYLAYLYKWSGSRWIKVGGGVSQASSALEVTIYEPGTYRAGWSLVEGTDRLAGIDRIHTALEIARQAFPTGADTVLLARADAFPDALAGAPLAYKFQAPILLTYPNQLPAEVLQYITDLKPKKIYLLGGTAAIAPSIENKLLDLAYVYRVAGANRYSTAAAAADLLGTTDQAVIVNGLNFPDAIAAASQAAIQGKPILLTPPNSLAPETEQALKRLSVTDSTVIGGPAVITAQIYSQLLSPERVSGANRFATSAQILQNNRPAGSILYIATGMNYPDALTGGVLAAVHSTNILLVPASGPTPEQALALENLKGTIIIALGGEGAVNAEALQKVKTLVK